MEWTKYVLACTLGVCMLILFGRRRRRKRQVDLWTGGGWKSGSHGADGGIYVPQGTVGHGFQCDEESGTVFVDRAGRLWMGMDPQP